MNNSEGGGGAKTLYVGNLDPSVTEDLILALFGQIGPVKGCKIIRETSGSDPYCFVEFTDHQAASAALTAMNRRKCFDKEMKVNWAVNPAGGTSSAAGGGPPGAKPDTSNHHHIFVGDLSPEIDTDTLRNAFAPFGEISDCKVVRDIGTNKSKGYGFCSFVRKVDAQTAIDQMNGQWLGSRSIRTNWATRKPPAPGSSSYGAPSSMTNSYGGSGGGKMNYDTVFNRASATNFTVYVGGISECDEPTLRRAFSSFGRILEIRYFKDKGYAFVRFDNKESACGAIVALHGSEIGGQAVKCSWGKENPTISSNSSSHSGQGHPSHALQPSSNLDSNNPHAYQLSMQAAAAAAGQWPGGQQVQPGVQPGVAAAATPQAAYYQQQMAYAPYMYNPQYMQQMQLQQQQHYFAQQQQQGAQVQAQAAFAAAAAGSGAGFGAQPAAAAGGYGATGGPVA